MIEGITERHRAQRRLALFPPARAFPWNPGLTRPEPGARPKGGLLAAQHDMHHEGG
ncbi:hypothetical protein ABT072_07935 [Streptomyces sp. NPDC002589]|uniref:hypothetical protein n=1 Tax=Streptomyces sp. NPDC002589 TaxID=3154420 RepID=UPI00332A1831